MAHSKPGEGLHLIADAYVGEGLDQKKTVRRFIKAAVASTGGHEQKPLHLRNLDIRLFPNGYLPWWKRMIHWPRPITGFGPGVTANGTLSESHITLHTRPECGYINFDLFSCRSFNVEHIRKIVDNYFGVKRWTKWEVMER